MANEKRLIDAHQFRGKHEVAEVNGKLCSVICYADIVNAPTVDAVEVVRCEGCEYRHDSCFAGKGNTYCDLHHKYFPLDGFCNYGKTKHVDCEIAENIESCEDCGFCAVLERMTE